MALNYVHMAWISILPTKKCPEPELKINEYSSCVKYIECDGRRIGRLPHGDDVKSHGPGCRAVHGYGLISVCYEYICNIIRMDQPHQGSGEGSGEGPGEGSGDEGSGDVLE